MEIGFYLQDSKLRGAERTSDAGPNSRDPCVMAETGQMHMDYRVLWRKRDSTATLSRGEHLHPGLDRLLFLFWAHYIEDGPHLLCTGSLQVVTENKGEDVANYIKKEGYLQMLRENWLNWLH